MLYGCFFLIYKSIFPLFSLCNSLSRSIFFLSSKSFIDNSLVFKFTENPIKKIFRDGDEVVQEVNDKISNFNEERIPYEKRIHLMKADDYVKSKAMDKLKEINNSKNGESNAKAQQYLDGLLKIPFGNYKKEVIRYKLDELITKYDKVVGVISRDVGCVIATYKTLQILMK